MVGEDQKNKATQAITTTITRNLAKSDTGRNLDSRTPKKKVVLETEEGTKRTAQGPEVTIRKQCRQALKKKKAHKNKSTKGPKVG